RSVVIETDPYGDFLTQGYDFASARDWARLGNLYLQDGVWNGERILPEGFVRLREHRGSGMDSRWSAHLRRVLLDQRGRRLARSAGRLLHGRCRGAVHHNHPVARPGRGATGALPRLGRRNREFQENAGVTRDGRAGAEPLTSCPWRPPCGLASSWR